MIVNKEEMLLLEKNTTLTTDELISAVGEAIAKEILYRHPNHHKGLILCGSGNNGADGYSCALSLCQKHHITLFNINDHHPSKWRDKCHDLPSISEVIELVDFDYIVDAIFGISFHLPLSNQLKRLFQQINKATCPIYSIDINSGLTINGDFDDYFIQSTHTFCVMAYKPFTQFKKLHHAYKDCSCVLTNIVTPIKTSFFTMDSSHFRTHYPKKSELAYKGENDKACLISGSKYMIGATILNHIGCKSGGCSMVIGCVDDVVYPLVAPSLITSIFKPLSPSITTQPWFSSCNVVCFGSGCDNIENKEKLLENLMNDTSVPLVLDATALRMVTLPSHRLAPTILTPHMGEFNHLINNKKITSLLETAQQFAKENNVILVLKGAHTIVASPNGQCYINQSGNQALAQAGSGDFLSGLISALLLKVSDSFIATSMAVWLSGYSSDEAIKKHSQSSFDLKFLSEEIDIFLHSIGK